VQRLIVKSRQCESGFEVPPLNISVKPWIPEREWTLCPWTPEYIYGMRRIANPFADRRMNIWLYSRLQMTDYIEMFDSFGFSGVQLIDTCFSWAAFGSVDAFHDRLKVWPKQPEKTGRG
jgi:hypothetical protein